MTLTKPPVELVLYHAGCWDGFCAAWLLHRVYPDAEFVPVQYGQDPPPIHMQHVMIVDFSYSRAVMLDIADRAASLTVLDHHKTANVELDGFGEECRGRGYAVPTVVFDMTKSGAQLTWAWLEQHELVDGHFEPGEVNRPPWMVPYTADRDLWKHELPDTKAINAALRSYPLEFDQWNELYKRQFGWKSWRSFAEEGQAILRYQDSVIGSHVGFARKLAIPTPTGLVRVPFVNATTLISEIGGKLAKGRLFSVVWFQRKDGKFVHSLRSDELGWDVSEIARYWGGGGHRNAAGFEADHMVGVVVPEE